MPSVMYEMLRSFVVVANTLNITRAVDILGVTRQTIRRHLDDLEQLLGFQLFTITSRQYQITRQGKQYLAGADNLLSDLENWIETGNSSNNTLKTIRDQNEDDSFFYFGQHHEFASIWKSGVPLLKMGITSWTESQGDVEHAAFGKIRPYLLMFRKNRDRWLCTYVGKQSSYATWLGLTWAKSAIGSSIEEDAANPQDSRFVIEAYDWVNDAGCPRYDHVYGSFKREEDGTSIPVSFQRIILPCTLPDGERVIGTLVARSNCIDIEGLEASQIITTPEDELMEFEI